MKDAPRTWALVVGIDEYDDPTIPRLTGAARDAVATVSWLRRLGVPDAQILFCAAPCADARAVVEGIGLPVRGCTEPEVWKAIAHLRKQSGERLFVFLSGHGLFEPTTERLFLTQEASRDDMANLGITEYVRLFRSMDFRRQFIFLDGCQNYPYSPSQRTEFRAAMHGSITPPPARAETTVVSCFAASQGERALEVEGRGIFLSELLRAVDPVTPDDRCLSIDDDDGSFRISLEQAMEMLVGPVVTTRAAAKGWGQHPAKRVDGQGEAWASVPFVSITPKATARLAVTVDPAEAVDDVGQIRIRGEGDVAFDKVLPVPPAPSVAVPVTGVFPVGTEVSVRCRLRPGVPTPSTLRRDVTLTADEEVRFQVAPHAAPPSGQVVITSVGGDGSPVDALTRTMYTDLARLMTPAHGITMLRREIGPVLLAPSGVSPADLARITDRMAHSISVGTPTSVQVAIEAAEPLATTGTLRLTLPRGGARQLAGALADGPILEVGDRRLSLYGVRTSLDVEVEEGLTDVRVVLPWGQWTARARVEAGGTSTHSLPASVGLPPLRVGPAADAALAHLHGDTLIVAGRVPATPPRTWAPAADGGPVAGLGVVGDQVAPGVFAFPETTRPDWSRYAVLRGRTRLVLPLSPRRPVLVALGRAPRAEPFSDTRYPEWDLLVTSGRLDVLTKRQAEELSWGKWEDPMLGVAAAYSLLALGEVELLQIVLGNLAGLEPSIPDTPVIHATLNDRLGRDEPAVEQRLAELAAATAVPVLRWGVPLALIAAERRKLTGWSAALRSVEAGLAETSVWTVWRPGTARRR